LLLTNESIVEELKRLDKETKAIIKNIVQLCWYMRGGLTYQEALMTSLDEQDIIFDLVKDNLETTKKTGLPFF
jgi:hypothetical protein